MYSSDDESIESEENEFITHLPSETTPKQLPDVQIADDLVKKVWKIHHEILDKTREKFAFKIMDFIQQNYEKESKKENKMEEEKDFQNKSIINSLSLKKPQKLIFPICIRKSQEEYIESFMDVLVKTMSDTVDKADEEPDCEDNEQLKKEEKYSGFKRFRKINVHSKPGLTEVCQVALFIRQKINEFHLDNDISIYVANEVTNLSNDNINVIEEGLADMNCCIIAPTFKSFEETYSKFQQFSSVEIVPEILFEHKTLFRELMFKCICDSEIKAYLPKESLKLVQDFEDFPITFVEGTHRLVYCIHKLETLRQRRKVSFKHIEIGNVFQTIEELTVRMFRIFQYRSAMVNKYIACILDESQPFNILDRFLNKNQFYETMKETKLTEDDLLKDLRGKFIRNFERKDELKQYSYFFKENEASKRVKKKSEISNRLKIETNVSLSEKNILENQLASLINHLTNDIRRQAQNFKWSEFEYNEQIKPMLPYFVYHTVLNQSPPHQKILNFIYKKITMPLLTIISNFCEDEDMDYGELMYRIKDLELLGLINVTHNALNPTVTPNFFEKASYACRKIQ